MSAAIAIDPAIFRAYDIRGLVDSNFTAAVLQALGRAVGSEAAARGGDKIVVGRDGRHSSPALAAALIAGLRAAGRDVIDIGLAPTPLLYFATQHLGAGNGAMVTGSHNGPEYNGLKIVLGGETLAEGAIANLYRRVIKAEFAAGQGGLREAEVAEDYIRRIVGDVAAAGDKPLKIVLDAGNGAAGELAPRLFRALGHKVCELFCEVDGAFPNHHPDPSRPENLQDLIRATRRERADVGFAFDGDGDRLGVVDNTGAVIWPDRQLMLLARDVLARNPGAAVIYDVKCSRHLKTVIEAAGGRAAMWRTGHSLIKARMKELRAPLAGEMSGHLFFAERWYGFDDALYAAARFAEILVRGGRTAAELFADLPGGPATPELKIAVEEARHQAVMDALREKMAFPDAEIIELDGIRVEFADGWGLIRPSNTTPCLVLRFEAEHAAALARIQGRFHDWLQTVDPRLAFQPHLPEARQ